MSSYILWLSLDIVRCKIDLYPYEISKKIEENFKKFKNKIAPRKIYIGHNFYNATIYFSTDSDSYHSQTTPPKYKNNILIKQSGYRIVKRIELNYKKNYIKLHAIKNVDNEWRLVDYYKYKNIYDCYEIHEFIIKNIDSNYLIYNNIQIPHEYICPISQEIMIEPVNTIDNYTYDKNSIEEWFKKSNISPLTGLVLKDLKLTPNCELLNKINEYNSICFTA